MGADVAEARRPEHLLILGCGYVGEQLAHAALQQGVRVSATTRRPERARCLQAHGIHAVVAASPEQLESELLLSVDALVDSIPLMRDQVGIYALQPSWVPLLAPCLMQLKWAGYLSTTGVYGDAGGAWVDEQDACAPTSVRGAERLKAERAWLDSGLPAEVFRLAGIYGPERNILNRLKAGGYRAVEWQPPHFSSRIHVDDIVAALLAAMQRPRPGRIVNLADDLPWPHADYVREVAAMIGAPAPQLLTPEQGEVELSEAAMHFFRDSKRVSNRLLHRELLPQLKYPDFRAGIGGLLNLG